MQKDHQTITPTYAKYIKLSTNSWTIAWWSRSAA